MINPSLGSPVHFLVIKTMNLTFDNPPNAVLRDGMGLSLKISMFYVVSFWHICGNEGDWFQGIKHPNDNDNFW